MKKTRPSPPEYWNRAAAEFDAIYAGKKNRAGAWLDSLLRKDMFQRFEYTMEASRPIEGRTFLDAGCGTGHYALALARRRAAKVIGIDFSDVMVGICKERAVRENLRNTEFLRSDILDFEGEEPFDVAIAIGLFDYTKDPAAVLGKLGSRLRDKIIASFPRAGTARALIRKARLATRGCGVFFYSRRDVETLMADAGLKIIAMKTLGQLFCVTAGPVSGRP